MVGRIAAGSLLLAYGLYALVAFKSAWLCDDAFITLRTVDNWVSGYGLRWNIAERVQAYTHPLWMMLLSLAYFATREAYYTTLALSLSLSLAAVSVLRRSAVAPAGAAVGIGALVCSKAFVDYSSSGLENPLVHLCIAVFCALYYSMGDRAYRWMPLVACLCACTRMDTLLLLAPALVYAARKTPWRETLVWTGAGFAPLGLWVLFSLFYYGAPVPNTAYAKLNTGIAMGPLVDQGIAYLVNSLKMDPATLAVIALGVGLSLGAVRDRALGLGIVAYMGYVVSIGGDFMSGRFISGPVLVAAILIARRDFAKGRMGLVAAALVAVGLFATQRSPLRASVAYGPELTYLTDEREIADERGHYYGSTGLFATERPPLAEHQSAREGRSAKEAGESPVLAGNIGFFGFYAGPGVHVLDGFALADPLLSRLPIRSIHWRVGHYVRDVPDGYWETLASGRNQLVDPRLNSYYHALGEVVRGPLWSVERVQQIWRLNTGYYDGLVEPFFRSRHLQDEGFALLENGEAERALAIFEQAVGLDSTRAAAWHGIARAQRLLGDDRAAIVAARWALAREPHRRAYQDELLQLAIACDDRGEWAAALRLYGEVLSCNPRLTEVRLRLGRIYELVGRKAEAIDQYRAYLAEHPDDIQVATHLRGLGAP